MPLSDKTVLIVDDDEKTVKMLRFLLKSSGCKVDSAINGMEALNMLEKTRPDVIILDLIMPKMDGLEFCEKLKKNDKYADIPIIIQSTLSEKKEKDRLKALGIDCFLEKPVTTETIMSRVLEVI